MGKGGSEEIEGAAAAGWTDKQCAKRLIIGERAVNKRLLRLYDLLNVSNLNNGNAGREDIECNPRTMSVRIGLERGLITVDELKAWESK